MRSCGPLLLSAVVAASSMVVARNASAVTFDDGRVHVVDAANSFPFEGVLVDDGPPPRPTTTLEVVSGGEIGTVTEDDVTAFGISEVTISGGTLGRDLWLYDTTDLRMFSGLVTRTIRVQDNARATIFGGSALTLFTMGQSLAQIVDGVIGELNTNGQSSVSVIGGEITQFFRVNSDSRVSVEDVEISCTENPECHLRVSDEGYLRFRGGHVEGDFVTTNLGFAILEGGTIAGSLFALDGSGIWIRGSDFNYPIGEIWEASGTLTGTLLDGTPINIAFEQDLTAQILLPEARALTALGSGIAILGLLYRRRRYCVEQ